MCIALAYTRITCVEDAQVQNVPAAGKILLV